MSKSPTHKVFYVRLPAEVAAEVERERASRQPIPSQTQVISEVLEAWAKRRARRAAK